jgi:FAD/FMN-containing dehydrogenase/Fe-S oxidoreductase
MKSTALPVIANAAAFPDRTVDAAGLLAALKSTIAGEVRSDRLSRALYSTDASVYQIVPVAVVLPRTEADIVATVCACRQYGVPLTARGGGTSQAGQSIGPGVILDCSKYFNRVLEINPRERWARVEPGCVLDDLNRAVRPHNLQFAPDISTSSRATIGGMVANNSSGTRSVFYGKTIDHVAAVKVVFADGSTAELGPVDAVELDARCRQQDREGAVYRVTRELATEHAAEIAERFPRILRRVGGYNLDAFVPGRPAIGGDDRFNLAHLLVGSEGTLAVVVEATLRLVAIPRAKVILVVEFAGLLDALECVPAILAHRPSAVEVIDQYVLDSTKLNPDASRLRDFLHGDPGAILIIELSGDTPAELDPRLDALDDDLRQRGVGLHRLAVRDPVRQARIWKLRTLSLGLSMAEKGDAKAISFVEDTAVAPERLRDYIAELLALIADHGTKAGVYAHASVGCLHVRPVVNLKTEEGVRRFEAIAAGVAALVLKYGGALSGEHGDGLVRSPFQEQMFGPVLYQAFRTLKRTFDPDNLFNPGKIVDAPPLAASLRYGAAYVTPAVATTFDFSAEGGLLPAAELCAGVGECRKTRAGTMCPSYRATRDERDSTRGRANALRLAITGQLGFQGFTDPALHEVLDFCLECKACKGECPTNVDMARLKSEFLHQYYKKHGLPLRNRIFGRAARIGRIGCEAAPVSNWLTRSRLVRRLNEVLLGIDRRRVPPAFARRSLSQEIVNEALWPSGGSLDDQTGPGTRDVLLFPDTFINYYEPDHGIAALELLKAAVRRVQIGLPQDFGARHLRCCGRPQISNGLLDEGVANARHNVALLHEWAEAGYAIVACEPSCLLTIKDDYPALLRGEERRNAETVAAACQTFEECLESLLGELASPAGLAFRAGPKQILVQGHCHQRSLVGMSPLLKLLGRVPGAEVIDLDAGCCGLAGSFGYEREHYDVSRLVGEARLLPAIRQAGPEPDVAIVAPGFSCRLQIAHFTGRTALSTATLLNGLVASGDSAPLS